MEGTEVIEGLDERIVGRHTKKTIYHPETGEVILSKRWINYSKMLLVLFWMLVLKK